MTVKGLRRFRRFDAPRRLHGKEYDGRREGPPSGRFVWVSNRGHDSLAGFAFDAASAKLTALGQTPTEKNSAFVSTRTVGPVPLCGGEGTGKLAAYRIDAATGRLERFTRTKSARVSPGYKTVDSSVKDASMRIARALCLLLVAALVSSQVRPEPLPRVAGTDAQPLKAISHTRGARLWNARLSAHRRPAQGPRRRTGRSRRRRGLSTDSRRARSALPRGREHQSREPCESGRRACAEGACATWLARVPRQGSQRSRRHGWAPAVKQPNALPLAQAFDGRQEAGGDDPAARGRKPLARRRA